jgi:hypothetical protein
LNGAHNAIGQFGGLISDRSDLESWRKAASSLSRADLDILLNNIAAVQEGMTPDKGLLEKVSASSVGSEPSQASSEGGGTGVNPPPLSAPTLVSQPNISPQQQMDDALAKLKEAWKANNPNAPEFKVLSNSASTGVVEVEDKTFASSHGGAPAKRQNRIGFDSKMVNVLSNLGYEVLPGDPLSDTVQLKFNPVAKTLASLPTQAPPSPPVPAGQAEIKEGNSSTPQQVSNEQYLEKVAWPAIVSKLEATKPGSSNMKVTNLTPDGILIEDFWLGANRGALSNIASTLNQYGLKIGESGPGTVFLKFDGNQHTV